MDLLAKTLILTFNILFNVVIFGLPVWVAFKLKSKFKLRWSHLIWMIVLGELLVFVMLFLVVSLINW